jgi:hypothetical protein
LEAFLNMSRISACFSDEAFFLFLLKSNTSSLRTTVLKVPNF